MRVTFSKTAKREHDAWEKSSPRVVEKIAELIEDICKNGFMDGLGKPEQLRHYKNPPRFSWHIAKADRLVYSLTGENDLYIISCKGHYEDT